MSHGTKRLSPALCVAIITLLISVALFAGERPYSLGGGVGDPLPPPPAPITAPTSSTSPTLLKTGPLPTLIASSVSDRFLLRLRRANGELVDHARADVRSVVILSGPLDEVLLLDVLPLDGTGVPRIGVPVMVGAGVAIRVGTATR